MNLINFIKNIFSKTNYSATPDIEFGNSTSENPVVIIVIGNKRMSMSTTQARSIFGQLGKALERITPDKKEYRA